MNLAAVRAALAGVITTTTGIAAADIFWSRRPRGWHSPRYALLRLDSIVAVGRDAVWYDYDVTRPVGAELIPTELGLRSATWIVQIWSHDATDTADALEAITALRDRLHLDTIRDALQAVDIGIAEVLGSRDIETRQDGREMSVSQLDIGLNATSNATGTAIGYVDQWGVKGDAAAVPGGPLSIPIIDDVVP